MSKFYDKMTATASKLLTKFGQKVTFTRITTGVYDPATGEPATTTSTFTGNGAAFGFTKMEVDGASILSNDIKFLVERMTKVPEVNDYVNVSGKDMMVLSVVATSPAGEDVVYECQLRMGDKSGNLR